MRYLFLVLLLCSFAHASPFFPYYNVFTYEPVEIPFFTLSLQNYVVMPAETEVTKRPVKEELIFITIIRNNFDPETVTVKVNQTIIWKNERKTQSLLLGVREISMMKSRFLHQGDTFQYYFSTPGNYTYVDGVMIGVVGKINVEELP